MELKYRKFYAKVSHHKLFVVQYKCLKPYLKRDKQSVSRKLSEQCTIIRVWPAAPSPLLYALKHRISGENEIKYAIPHTLRPGI